MKWNQKIIGVAAIFLILLLLVLPGIASAEKEKKAESNELGITDVMGSPKEMLAPQLEKVRWLFGTVYGWAFLVILLCIAIAIIKSAYGTVTGNAAVKQESKSAAIDIVAIVFIGVVATGIVVYLFNTFIFT